MYCREKKTMSFTLEEVNSSLSFSLLSFSLLSLSLLSFSLLSLFPSLSPFPLSLFPSPLRSPSTTRTATVGLWWRAGCMTCHPSSPHTQEGRGSFSKQQVEREREGERERKCDCCCFVFSLTMCVGTDASEAFASFHSPHVLESEAAKALHIGSLNTSPLHHLSFSSPFFLFFLPSFSLSLTLSHT
jgi:hypothetical protein